jgi:hypothetical protein
VRARRRIPRFSTALLPGEQEAKTAIDRRLSTLQVRRDAWDPQMRQLFDSHLIKIDQSLNQCRQHLLATPADQEHLRMLMALYQEKQQLLEDFDKLK